MVKTALRVAINCSTDEDLKSQIGTEGSVDALQILTDMTSIFRMGFEQVFDSVRSIEEPAVVILDDCSLLCRRIVILASSSSRMDSMEGPDYMIILELVTQDETTDIVAVRDRVLSSSAILNWAKSILRQLAKTGYGVRLTKFIGHERGSSTWTVKEDGKPNITNSLLFAFFHYGWVILLRLEREQSNLRLSNDLAELTRGTQTILQHRIRLINLERYFLTHDRSSHPEYKAICDDFLNKYNLRARFDRLLSIHEAFELYIQDMTRILESKRSRATTRALKFLAGCSIPISIFGALLKADTSAEIFSRTNDVFVNPKLYTLLLISALPVVLIIALARIADGIGARVHKMKWWNC